MDICVSADHKNAIWKLFKTFPSWNCLERLQTTLPYGLVAYGLMHATLLFLHHHPPLPWWGQSSCRDKFTLGWFFTCFCTFSSHSHHLCSQPARYRQHSMYRNRWPHPHPMHVCFFLLIQKLPVEAFRTKQNAYSASAGKFYLFVEKIFSVFDVFSSFFSCSTLFGVLVWQILMILLLLPSPFLHVFYPLAEP